MAVIGMYCKAFTIKDLRSYESWDEICHNTYNNMGDSDNIRGEDDVVFLHENYTVTLSIFQDEGMVFDKVDEKWKDFCHSVLDFNVPTLENNEVRSQDD
jgi:hypothetical protein